MKKYGRPPKKNEVIHHLNDDPWCNDHTNLVYLPKGVHMWLHRWAKWGVLKTYASEIQQAVLHLGSPWTTIREVSNAKAKD